MCTINSIIFSTVYLWHLWHDVHVFYLPNKGSPGDAEFHCPLIMADFPQCLSSRVPPPHPAPPWSLALYNDDVSWYWLWVPPRTLLRVLFKQSCTNTINTLNSHIFDVFNMHTIYSNVLHLCSTCIWHSYLCTMDFLNYLLVGVEGVDGIPCELSPYLDGSFSFFFFWMSDILGVVFILAILGTNWKNNHKPGNDAVQWLSSLMRGYHACTVKVIAQHHFAVHGFSFNLFNFPEMSWAKSLAEAGLAGLSERKAST